MRVYATVISNEHPRTYIQSEYMSCPSMTNLFVHYKYLRNSSKVHMKFCLEFPYEQDRPDKDRCGLQYGSQKDCYEDFCAVTLKRYAQANQIFQVDSVCNYVLRIVIDKVFYGEN